MLYTYNHLQLKKIIQLINQNVHNMATINKFICFKFLPRLHQFLQYSIQEVIANYHKIRNIILSCQRVKLVQLNFSKFTKSCFIILKIAHQILFSPTFEFIYKKKKKKKKRIKSFLLRGYLRERDVFAAYQYASIAAKWVMRQEKESNMCSRVMCNAHNQVDSQTFVTFFLLPHNPICINC